MRLSHWCRSAFRSIGSANMKVGAAKRLAGISGFCHGAQARIGLRGGRRRPFCPLPPSRRFLLFAEPILRNAACPRIQAGGDPPRSQGGAPVARSQPDRDRTKNSPAAPSAPGQSWSGAPWQGPMLPPGCFSGLSTVTDAAPCERGLATPLLKIGMLMHSFLFRVALRPRSFDRYHDVTKDTEASVCNEFLEERVRSNAGD